MRPEEINFYIHREIMGQCGHPNYLACKNCIKHLKDDSCRFEDVESLDYYNDLNAIAKVEAKIKENDLVLYRYVVLLGNRLTTNGAKHQYKFFEILTFPVSIRAECLVEAWQWNTNNNKKE